MKILAALFAAVLLLAGCTQSDSGGAKNKATPAAPITIKIAIKDGKVTPQGKRVNVQVGQKITLQITTDAPDLIHVHSEPEHEYALAQGDAASFSFRLKVPGQVAVEAHRLDVTILQLVVRK